MRYLDSNKYVWLLIGTFVFIFAATYLASEVKNPGIKDLLGFVSQSVGIEVVLVTLFRTHLWRWKFLQGWLVPFPDLQGTWKGTLKSNWQNPETKTAVSAISVVLTVKQSFTHISCVMRSAEMTSRSYLAEFWLDGNEQLKRLGYSYHSVPRVSLRNRSAIHDGTVIFDIHVGSTMRLNGVYWTDRGSTGEIELTFAAKDLLDEFPSDLGKHPMSNG